MAGSARRLLGQARKLMEEGRSSEALEAGRAAVERAPDDAGVRLQSALLFLDQGDPRAAADLLEEHPPHRNPAWPVFLALAYADMGALGKAQEHVRAALEMAKENRLARGIRATILLRAGKPEEALAVLDKAGMEASPRLIGRLLVEVERALIALGESEGGRLRGSGPEARGPLDGTAEAAAREAKMGDEAAGVAPAESAGEAAEERRDGSPAVAGEAAEERRDGSPAVAGEAAEEPVAGTLAGSDAEDVPVPWDASVYRQKGLDRVIGSLFDPLYAQRLLARAEREIMQASRTDEAGRNEAAARALAAAREAVHRYPDVPRGFCILAHAYLMSGQAREALRCLDEAAVRDGETPDVLYAQGCCWHELGDLGRARERLTKMLAAFEKDAAAHYTLGQIDLEEGKELEARRHFEQAAFLDFLLVKERVQRLRVALRETKGSPA
jgi:tetratricopeptide (TPR) repeat protein